MFVDIRALRNDRVTLVEKGSPHSVALIESGKVRKPEKFEMIMAFVIICAHTMEEHIRTPNELYALFCLFTVSFE